MYLKSWNIREGLLSGVNKEKVISIQASPQRINDLTSFVVNLRFLIIRRFSERVSLFVPSNSECPRYKRAKGAKGAF